MFLTFICVTWQTLLILQRRERLSFLSDAAKYQRHLPERHLPPEPQPPPTLPLAVGASCHSGSGKMGHSIFWICLPCIRIWPRYWLMPSVLNSNIKRAFQHRPFRPPMLGRADSMAMASICTFCRWHSRSANIRLSSAICRSCQKNAAIITSAAISRKSVIILWSP